MEPRSPLHPLVELARVSNLPTCVTNTLVGCALGAGSTSIPWLKTAAVGLAVCLIYTFGVVLNDILDADNDSTERPHRPIPSGRVSPTTAWLLALSCAAGGLSIAYTLGGIPLAIGVVLCIAIVLYDLFHLSARWPIFLLGVCRALIYLLAAAAVAGPSPTPFIYLTTWGFSVVLGGYIVSLSHVARNETQDDRPAIPSVVAVPVVPLLALIAVAPTNWLWTFSVGAVMLAWLARGTLLVYARPPRIPHAIRTWIAGICLVDAFFLSLLDRPALAVIATAAWALTTWAQTRVSGT